MLRERLSISGSGLGDEQREQESDFVYDLYYQETVTPGWIQDILSVRPYADEGELVCWMDGCMDGRKEGRMEGWTDTWMRVGIAVSEWRDGKNVDSRCLFAAPATPQFLRKTVRLKNIDYSRKTKGHIDGDTRQHLDKPLINLLSKRRSRGQTFWMVGPGAAAAGAWSVLVTRQKIDHWKCGKLVFSTGGFMLRLAAPMTHTG